MVADRGECELPGYIDVVDLEYFGVWVVGWDLDACVAAGLYGILYIDCL
jgi:hypothetical protein